MARLGWWGAGRLADGCATAIGRPSGASCAMLPSGAEHLARRGARPGLRVPRSFPDCQEALGALRTVGIRGRPHVGFDTGPVNRDGSITVSSIGPNSLRKW